MAFRVQDVIARGATPDDRQDDARVVSGAVQAFFQGHAGRLGPEEMAVGTRGILRRAAGTKAAFVVVNRAERTVSVNKDSGTPWAAVTAVFALYQTGPLVHPGKDEQSPVGPWRCVAFTPGSGPGVRIAAGDKEVAAHDNDSEMVKEMRKVMGKITAVTNSDWWPVDLRPVTFKAPDFQPRWAAGGILLVLLDEVTVRGIPIDGIESLWQDEARYWEIEDWRNRGQTIMYANC